MAAATWSRHPRPADERFWEKIDAADCWEWTAGTNWAGYGIFNPSRGVHVVAHRYAYETLVGPLPKEAYLDHLCRNRRCVNPDHLEPVSPRENNRRSHSPTAVNSRKTHCKNGHEFTPENTYSRPDRFERACRICRRERMREFMASRRSRRR